MVFLLTDEPKEIMVFDKGEPNTKAVIDNT